MMKSCTGDFKPYPYIEQNNWFKNYYGWQTCEGMEQSPINILESNTTRKKGRPLQITYKKPEVPVGNNGHQVVVLGNFGTLTINKTLYTSVNFHFHNPAEHRINGWRGPVEMHHVYKAEDGSAAVVGIIFKIGKQNKCLKEVLRNPPIAGCQSKPLKNFVWKCFKPILKGNYWRYDGGLTTPPCSEVVTWSVMETMATMSKKQYRALKSRYPNGIARSVQPLNGRTVTCVSVH